MGNEASWATARYCAVERALEDFVNRAKARRILDLAHSGLWDGDLAEMRRDRPMISTTS
jgi:hypothetical protein